MYSNFDIPLSDDYKRLFIESIVDARGKDIRDFRENNNLTTNNNGPFLIWDFINTNLTNKLPKDQFQCCVVNRGRWSFVLVYDDETKFLYSLMSKQRYKEVRNTVKKRNIHYLDALTLLNLDLEKERVEQICMFEVNTKPQLDYKEKLLRNMINKIKDEIKCYCLINFSTDKDEIKSMDAYILNSTLDILEEENWNELIPVDYSKAVSSVNISENDLEEEEDIPIGLKIKDNNNNINMKIRKNKGEKEKRS